MCFPAFPFHTQMLHECMEYVPTKLGHADGKCSYIFSSRHCSHDFLTSKHPWIQETSQQPSGFPAHHSPDLHQVRGGAHGEKTLGLQADIGHDVSV